MKIYIAILIYSLIGFQLNAQDRIVGDVDSARFVTQDIDNFWKAFDLLSRQHTTNDSLQIIKDVFITPASEGLTQYMEAANCHEKEYLEAIRKKKADYLSIRRSSQAVAGKSEQLRNYLRKFKERYPSLRIPTICFAIGKFEVGGTQFPNTLFIGTEKDLQAGVDILAQVIHELAHFQQKNQNPETNLELAMIEGGAEFISFHITGKRTIPLAWKYGEAHKAALLNEFKSIGNSTIDMNWFMDTFDNTHHRPGSLGYFIGFKMTEEYFVKHASSPTAFRKIVEMEDGGLIYQGRDSR